MGEYSDDRKNCHELNQAVKWHDLQRMAFKTPTLRNVGLHARYMHGGQLKNLEAVIDHYASKSGWSVSHTELNEIELTLAEKKGLICFLKSLTSFPSQP